MTKHSDKRIDKRTIEASYVKEIIDLYGENYPTIVAVLSRYLTKCGYTDEQIESIAEEETFDTVISAMRYGDYLANVKQIMQKFAKHEYKSVSDIEKYFEVILAERYGVSTCNIEVYEGISPALKRLVKEGSVEKIENPEHANWNLYKYIE